jgi:hypothetical protein
MDIVVSSSSPAELTSKLLSLSLLHAGEGSLTPAAGITLSIIGYSADQSSYSALLRIDPDAGYNLSLIQSELVKNFNYANPPLRVIAGADVRQLPSWEAIKWERDRRKLESGYQVAGKWYHSDTFSRIQQIGLVLLGANIPAGLQWRTMDGSFVAMTQQLAGQIFAAAAGLDAGLFKAAETARVTLEALPIEERGSFDMNTIAWPPSYVAV